MRGWLRGSGVPLLLGLVLPAFLLGLWQFAAEQRWIDTLFYPAPWDVAQRTWEQARSGDLLADAWVTSRRLLIGFAAGAIPGGILGLAAGISRLLRRLLYPLATALYVVPRIAMLPLVLVAFAITDTARIFMVGFSVFFVVFFAALSAAEQVPAVHLETARAFGAGPVRLISTVLVPASAPAVFSGLRIAMGFALIVIVGTEFLASNDGLGARIWQSYQIFDFPSMYAGIVAVTLLGVVFNLALLVVERIALPWARQT